MFTADTDTDTVTGNWWDEPVTLPDYLDDDSGESRYTIPGVGDGGSDLVVIVPDPVDGDSVSDTL